jgi:ACS family tartrate transporter-like MFS transporter
MDAGERAMRKVMRRLVPFLGLMFVLSFIDRINIAFAEDQLDEKLGFTSLQYGVAAGIFFLGYVAFEIPSNLVLHRVGARRWLARIMVSWGLVAAAMGLATSPGAMYALRFLLGVAEAGLFPGVILYLTLWVPESHRAKAIAGFYLGLPISLLLGGPVSAGLLALDGVAGLHGYQWLFLGEGIPAVVVGVWALRRLDDSPADAKWLDDDEREWLQRTLAAERAARAADVHADIWPALKDRRILRLGLIAFVLSLTGYGVGFFVPDTLDRLNLSDIALPLVATVPFALGGIGILVMAHRAREVDDVRPLIAASIGLGAVGVMLSGLLPVGAAIPALAIAAFGLYGATPLFWTLPAGFLAGAGAAAGIAAINSIGALGGFAGPVLVGAVKDARGEPDLALVALGLVAAATALWVARQPRLRAQLSSSST